MVVGEGEVDETVVVLVLVVFLALNSLFQMTHILLKLVERIFSCLFLFVVDAVECPQIAVSYL